MKPAFLRPLALALCVLGLAPMLSAAPKVGVLLKGRISFWNAVGKGAEQAGRQLGADIIVKAPLSEIDVAVQIRLLQALSAQGIDALVIAPCNEDTLVGPVAALVARGVKVVVIDSPLAGPPVGPFVGTDQNAAGEAAGRLLAGVIGDTDEVSLLRHTQTSVAATQRETGALAVLRGAHPQLVIHGDIYASSEYGAEAEQAAFLLKKYPETKAIFASGSPGTMAMLKLLEARKPAGSIKFVGGGFNLNPEAAAALADGTMQGWLAQLPEDVGYKGVAAALALIAGQKVAPVISTDYILVTRDNLHDPKVQALLSN
jgi:ribose transport system substrate-binding protein